MEKVNAHYIHYCKKNKLFGSAFVLERTLTHFLCGENTETEQTLCSLYFFISCLSQSI